MSVKIISIHARGLPGTHKYKHRFLCGVCLLCGGEPSGMTEYFYGERERERQTGVTEIIDAFRCLLFSPRW